MICAPAIACRHDLDGHVQDGASLLGAYHQATGDERVQAQLARSHPSDAASIQKHSRVPCWLLAAHTLAAAQHTVRLT